MRLGQTGAIPLLLLLVLMLILKFFGENRG
jgi:hypothetical protein